MTAASTFCATGFSRARTTAALCRVLLEMSQGRRKKRGNRPSVVHVVAPPPPETDPTQMFAVLGERPR